MPFLQGILEFFGLNPAPEVDVADVFDSQETDPIQSIKELVEQNFLNQAQQKDTYFGICLQVEKTAEPPPDSWWSRVSGDLAEPTSPRFILRVKIPGIHDYLPDPYETASAGGELNPKIVCLYPIFIAREDNQDDPAPPVGSIVEVSFKDKNNLRQGVYIKTTKHKGPGDPQPTTSFIKPTQIIPSATPIAQTVATGDLKPRITSRFKMRINPVTGEKQHHQAVDIAVPVGTPIYAPFDGFVNHINKNPSLKQGNSIEIYEGAKRPQKNRSGRRRQGPFLKFFHLNSIPEAVITGSGFKKGQIIAYTGNTGSSTGPHLHLEYWQDSENRVDPLTKLDVNKDLFNV